MKRELYKQAADSLKQSLPVTLQCSMDLAQVKGASTWLTSLPIQEFGFALHKCAFQDMPWLFATTGNHCEFPLLVIVAQSFC